MFACPNCGGNLKYDIPSGQLSCEYCHTLADPYSFDTRTKDAVEEHDANDYEVTIFTCPQCGGEILSTDNAAAGFCSFCGASTILFSRISKEHRPGFVIPFQKTKEDCKQAYSDMMKKAIFAPSALKDPKKIDSFRGIYMPYWAFYFTQKGPVRLSGTKSHRRGDYVYTDHYNLTANVDAYYKGLSYDASSSFADNISEAIAPFDVRGMKKFTPGFLSGFYADTADVAPSVYEQDALWTASEETLQRFQKEKVFSGISMSQPNNAINQLPIKTESVDQALFPVWFMSYRNGDRVAYMTVNGQTGKVVSDLPVDPKKYILGSLILALPLFLILNLFFTLIPNVLLTTVGVIATIAAAISTFEIGQIVKRENNEDDLGMLSKTNPSQIAEQTKKRHKKKKKKEKPTSSAAMVILVMILFQFVFSIGFTVFAFLGTIFSYGLVWLIILPVNIFISIQSFEKLPQVPKKTGVFGMICTLVGIILGAGIMLIQPAHDLYYYGASILMLISVFLSELGIIEQYNLLATRKLPQFEKQGGDNRA